MPALPVEHARTQVAARLGALEHVEVDAVLEAAARPVPLDLDEDTRAHVARDTAQSHEGRANDGVRDRRQGATVTIPGEGHLADCTSRHRAIETSLSGAGAAERREMS